MTISPSSAISIPHLREEFEGRVIAPGDADYDAARRVFSGNVDSQASNQQ